MHRRIWTALIVLGGLGLCLASCASQRAKEIAATAAQPPAIGEPAETTTSEAKSEKPTALGPADRDERLQWQPWQVAASAGKSLSDLDSYCYTALFRFVREEDGDIRPGSVDVTGIISGANQHHLIWEELASGAMFEVIRIDDRAWVSKDSTWARVPVVDADVLSQTLLINSPQIAWLDILAALESAAEYVGPVRLNGIPAHYYTTTYAKWGGYWTDELAHSSGDVWIAEAGYPLGFSFTADCIDRDGDKGSATWTMYLFDVNESLPIEPPI